MASCKPSITEIARHAGVSPATVSRVMNHPELVSPRTVAQIRATMEELGYTPQVIKRPAARQLALINVPDFSNPFYDEVIKGIITSLDSHNINALINQDDLRNGWAMENFLSIARSVRACGIISCSHLQAPQYAQLAAVMPVVQCCEYSTEEYSFVTIDDYRAAYTAMEHIFSQGRSRIAFVNGPANYKYALERRRAYETFMAANSLPIAPGWIVQLPDINYDMGCAAIRQLLTSSAPPDAIFAVSDLLAAAAVRVAKSLGIRVPQDLVVVGFDNIDISTICDPPLTTVSQPRMQLGYTAGEILCDQITAPQAQPQQIFLQTELIIRESSGLVRSPVSNQKEVSHAV